MRESFFTIGSDGDVCVCVYVCVRVCVLLILKNRKNEGRIAPARREPPYKSHDTEFLFTDMGILLSFAAWNFLC